MMGTCKLTATVIPSFQKKDYTCYPEVTDDHGHWSCVHENIETHFALRYPEIDGTVTAHEDFPLDWHMPNDSNWTAEKLPCIVLENQPLDKDPHGPWPMEKPGKRMQKNENTARQKLSEYYKIIQSLCLKCLCIPASAVWLPWSPQRSCRRWFPPCPPCCWRACMARLPRPTAGRET